MGNILFQNNPQQQNNSLLNRIQQLKSQGPSNILFNQMYQNNPQFRQFADSMNGKTPEQAFRENGLDFNQFRNMRW